MAVRALAQRQRAVDWMLLVKSVGRIGAQPDRARRGPMTGSGVIRRPDYNMGIRRSPMTTSQIIALGMPLLTAAVVGWVEPAKPITSIRCN